MKNAIFIIVVCLLISFEALSRDNTTCGIVLGAPLDNAYGPWDFTNPEHQSKLPIVLGAHFTQEVEMLVKGNTGPIEKDIDYTLRAIPNYHRALFSMARLQRDKGITKAHANQLGIYTADCYFRRAIYFQPADAISRMLYAMHMQLTDRIIEAEQQYELAVSLMPQHPEINYNYGLLLVELGKLEKAKKHADIAYSQGYPLEGLRQRLEKNN